jgi:hypothetical protein
MRRGGRGLRLRPSTAFYGLVVEPSMVRLPRMFRCRARTLDAEPRSRRNSTTSRQITARFPVSDGIVDKNVPRLQRAMDPCADQESDTCAAPFQWLDRGSWRSRYKLTQVNASKLISRQDRISAQARLPAATPQSDCARQQRPCLQYRRPYHDRPKYGSPANRP